MASDKEAVKVRLRVRGIPVKDYLEDNVVPVLLRGLQTLIVEKPPNPVGFLGHYLKRNDPVRLKPKKDKECAHCAHMAAMPPPPPPQPAPPPPAEGEDAPPA